MPSNILEGPQADYFQRVQTSKYLISLKYPNKAKILFTLRSHDSILPHKWDDLDHFLGQHNMEILPSEPKGHCFANSVIACLENDYEHKISFDECVRIIVSHLCMNYNKYLDFHPTPKSEIPPADQLLSDALEFFQTEKFNQDIVDLLMQMTVDALHLNLFIYQHSEGSTIQVLNFQQPKSDWIVCLKFSHNNIHSGGNYYDVIVCQRHYLGNELQFLTDVATKLLSKTQPSGDEIR